MPVCTHAHMQLLTHSFTHKLTHNHSCMHSLTLLLCHKRCFVAAKQTLSPWKICMLWINRTEISIHWLCCPELWVKDITIPDFNKWRTWLLWHQSLRYDKRLWHNSFSLKGRNITFLTTNMSPIIYQRKVFITVH